MHLRPYRAGALQWRRKRSLKTCALAANVILFLFYLSPLSTALHVVRHRDSTSLTLPLCIMNAVNGAFWTAYGLILSDAFVWVPNAGAPPSWAIVSSGCFPGHGLCQQAWAGMDPKRHAGVASAGAASARVHLPLRGLASQRAAVVTRSWRRAGHHSDRPVRRLPEARPHARVRCHCRRHIAATAACCATLCSFRLPMQAGTPRCVSTHLLMHSGRWPVPAHSHDFESGTLRVSAKHVDRASLGARGRSVRISLGHSAPMLRIVLRRKARSTTQLTLTAAGSEASDPALQPI